MPTNEGRWSDGNPSAFTYEDVNQQWTQHREEEKNDKFTNMFTNSVGRTKETRRRSSQQRLLQEPSARQESVVEKECIW